MTTMQGITAPQLGSQLGNLANPESIFLSIPPWHVAPGF